MKLFKLEWYWYEDLQYYLFMHEEDKSQKEFDADVELMLFKYGEEYLKSEEKSWVGVPDWIGYIVPKMKELGYKLVEPDTYSFFGGYIIEGDDEDDKKWGKIVGKELYNAAIEHNRKIRESHRK